MIWQVPCYIEISYYIIGWEFSCSNEVKKSANSSKMFAFALDSSLNRVVCKSNQMKSVEIWQSFKWSFLRLFWPFGHLILIWWMHIKTPSFSLHMFMWNDVLSNMFGLWCHYILVYCVIDLGLYDEAIVYVF